MIDIIKEKIEIMFPEANIMETNELCSLVVYKIFQLPYYSDNYSSIKPYRSASNTMHIGNLEYTKDDISKNIFFNSPGGKNSYTQGQSYTRILTDLEKDRLIKLNKIIQNSSKLSDIAYSISMDDIAFMFDVLSKDKLELLEELRKYRTQDTKSQDELNKVFDEHKIDITMGTSNNRYQYGSRLFSHDDSDVITNSPTNDPDNSILLKLLVEDSLGEINKKINKRHLFKILESDNLEHLIDENLYDSHENMEVFLSQFINNDYLRNNTKLGIIMNNEIVGELRKSFAIVDLYYFEHYKEDFGVSFKQMIEKDTYESYHKKYENEVKLIVNELIDNYPILNSKDKEVSYIKLYVDNETKQAEELIHESIDKLGIFKNSRDLFSYNKFYSELSRLSRIEEEGGVEKRFYFSIENDLEVLGVLKGVEDKDDFNPIEIDKFSYIKDNTKNMENLVKSFFNWAAENEKYIHITLSPTSKNKEFNEIIKKESLNHYNTVLSYIVEGYGDNYNENQFIKIHVNALGKSNLSYKDKIHLSSVMKEFFIGSKQNLDYTENKLNDLISITINDLTNPKKPKNNNLKL